MYPRKHSVLRKFNCTHQTIAQPLNMHKSFSSILHLSLKVRFSQGNVWSESQQLSGIATKIKNVQHGWVYKIKLHLHYINITNLQLFSNKNDDKFFTKMMKERN